MGEPVLSLSKGLGEGENNADMQNSSYIIISVPLFYNCAQIARNIARNCTGNLRAIIVQYMGGDIDLREGVFYASADADLFDEPVLQQHVQIIVGCPGGYIKSVNVFHAGDLIVLYDVFQCFDEPVI